MSKLHLIAEKCDKKAEVTIIFNGDSTQANCRDSTSPRLIEEVDYSDEEKRQDFKSITVCSPGGSDCILYLDTSTMRMRTCPIYLPNGRTSKNYSTVWRRIPVRGARGALIGFKLQNYITPGASLHIMDKDRTDGKRNISFSETESTTFFYDGDRQHFYAQIIGRDGKEQRIYIVADTSTGEEMFIGSDKIEDNCRWKLDDVLVDNLYPISDKSTTSKL